MPQKIYNSIICTGDRTIGNQGFVKYRKITNIDRHIKFINQKFPDWVFINFYDKVTNEKTVVKKSAQLQN